MGNVFQAASIFGDQIKRKPITNNAVAIQRTINLLRLQSGWDQSRSSMRTLEHKFCSGSVALPMVLLFTAYYKFIDLISVTLNHHIIIVVIVLTTSMVLQ